MTGKTFPAFPAHAHLQFCVSGKRPIPYHITPQHITSHHVTVPADILAWLYASYKSVFYLIQPSHRKSVENIFYIFIPESNTMLRCRVYKFYIVLIPVAWIISPNDHGWNMNWYIYFLSSSLSLHCRTRAEMVSISWSWMTPWHFLAVLVKYTYYLTHLPLDKMAAISQTIFSNAFSWQNCILNKISLNFVPKCLIDNNPALV